jgi:Ca2+-binding RTX toxin-like protein
LSQRSNRLLTVIAGALGLSLMFAAVAMAARVVGDDGPNSLTGTPVRDLIVAKGGDDTVNALGGTDLVSAGAGNDSVDGGAGRDLVRGGLGDDSIRGGGGFPGRRGDLLHGNPGNDTVVGGPGFDLITGNAGVDNLNGGPGCDRIFAGPDDDTIAGGRGFSFRRFRCERLHGGVGNDVSNGGAGRDFMSGGQGDDVQSGGRGADKLFANPGRDKSDGGDGPDVLWAVARVDVTAIGDTAGDELSGGAGRDRIHVRDGEVDVVHCGPGRDLVITDQFDQVDADCEVRRQSDITSLDQVDDSEERAVENPSEDNDEG